MKELDEFLNELDPDFKQEPEQPKQPEQPEQPEQAEGATEEGAPEEVEQADEPAKQVEPAKDKNKPNPMAELRKAAETNKKEKEKLEGILDRFTEGDYDFKLKDFKNENGKVDYDALAQAMDEVDVKKRAETRGLSPEMQAELERYEKEKAEVLREKARVQLDRQLNNFQIEMKLENQELNTFISDSMKLGINPLAIAALDKDKGTNTLKYLHKAIYAEKFTQMAVDKAVAEARAEWEAERNQVNKAPKINPANPTSVKTTTPNNDKGLALEDFLNTL